MSDFFEHMLDPLLHKSGMSRIPKVKGILQFLIFDGLLLEINKRNKKTKFKWENF